MSRNTRQGQGFWPVLLVFLCTMTVSAYQAVGWAHPLSLFLLGATCACVYRMA